MRPQLLISLAAATAAVALGGMVAASADDLGAFTCTNRAGGVAGMPGTVASIRVAHHDGYDRLVFEFAPSSAGAMPAYSLTQQASRVRGLVQAARTLAYEESRSQALSRSAEMGRLI